MFGVKENNLGKVEKNQNVKEGPCIFPFKYKWKDHSECFDTPKGPICATSVSSRGTLKTYGYCKKGTKNKELKKRHRSTVKKLKIVESLKTSPQPTKMTRYNEAFVDVLDELQDLMTRKGDFMRARAYQKAKEPIASFPGDISDVNQLKDLRGIGKTILLKLDEFVKTGKVAAIEKELANPIHIFTKIYGVGPKKAQDLISKGITTLDQLRARQNEVLNDTQKLGLRYYDDINERIPRSEIDKFNTLVNGIFEGLALENPAAYEIVGSYRRGAKTSGDIDIIITSADGTPTIMHQLIDKLAADGIIEHKLTNGKTKVLVIGKLPGAKHSRRIDFLYSSPEEYPFAILYFTGSKYFNTMMRQHAVDLGYSLNEHGLTKGKKGAKIPEKMNSEEDIFNFLGLEYKKPEERRDSRAVIKISDAPFSLKIEKKSVPKKEATMPPLQLLRDFQSKGVKFLEEQPENVLASMILVANDNYTNDPDKTVLTDEQYDILKEYVERKYPKNVVLGEIGAPVRKNKVKLPYQMPSMDKIKPETGALNKWLQKYKTPSEYVLSTKLDGVSGLYVVKNGKKQLFTRGNGTFGQDISHIIPYLKLPEDQPNLVIRGEFIISKADFDTYYAETAKNPRNLVAGIINRITVQPESYTHLKFLAYEVIQPELKPSEQFNLLETLPIDTAWHENVKTLTNDMLSEKLRDLRATYPYEIDGIIVAHDKVYLRTGKNPEHAFAFKMVLSEQVAEAKVLDVIWTPSKDGFLKPRIQIEPLKLGGVVIEYATAFNAAFVEKNRIGIGAVVELVRSGDVIPHIMKVIRPAHTPLMPDVEYVWNSTHVDIMLVNKDDNQVVREKNITGFFKAIGVDGLSAGNVKRIMEAGYDSVPKILAMNKEDFLKVPGFKDKMATKLHTNIHTKIKEMSLATLMKATNLFGRGFGERRITPILETYPDILTSNESSVQKVGKLINIKGMAKKTAEAFVKQIPVFMAFIQQANLQYKLDVKPKSKKVITGHPLSGKRVVFSGFRPTELIKKIESVGGIIGTSVSKNTFTVIVKSADETTGKADQARQLNIPILTKEDFEATYFK